MNLAVKNRHPEERSYVEIQTTKDLIGNGLPHHFVARNDAHQHEHAQDDVHHIHKHEENCKECHHHDKFEKATNTKSIVKEIHLKNGHACTDDKCDIPVPHGHNLLATERAETKEEKPHVHGPNCNHEHKHLPVNTFKLKPLEDLITKSSLPQWLKEFSMNASFLSPAIIVSNITRAMKMPDWLSAWFAITSMHGINRGFNKLSRLMLTLGTSSTANLARHMGLNSNLTRFIATSLIAIIEKFSTGVHKHTAKCNHNHGPKKPDPLSTKIQKEFKTLAKNLSNKKHWQELLPSVLNVEAKVQIISPLMNYLNDLIRSKVTNSKNPILKMALQVLLTSGSFMGSDQILRKFAKFFGDGSAFASAISGICGCCGSTVCAAAATDTAMSQTTFPS